MRKELEQFWGEEIRFLAIRTRDRLSLTQREMSERLVMSESSYSDIETGRTNGGMLTTILLLKMQEDPAEFLAETEQRVTEQIEREAEWLPV
jgi:transcriptional regulator with XRE-family HTH domain